MSSLRRRLQAVAWLGVALAASPALRAQPEPPPARTEAELAAARKLFAEALKDEDDGHLDVALAKFRRVQDVRETAPVEYRIGTCLEGLGHFTDALTAYAAAVRLGQDGGAGSDVVPGSRDRVEALSRRVGHLALTLSSRAPQGAEVRVDGTTAARIDDIVLDPGTHHVEATAPGVAPFQSDIALPEGGRVSLTVPLDPPVVVAPPPQAPPPVVPPEPDGDHAGGSRTWGWITVGAGGALLVAAGVSLYSRESDIRTANRDCPGGGCVGAIDPEAQSATNRARMEGPLALGLGVAGVLAAGIGVVLVATSAPAHPRSLDVSPTASRDGAGVAVRGSF